MKKLVLFLNSQINGPGKVTQNLIKGLDRLNIDYILNPDMNDEYLKEDYIIYSSNNL